MEVPTLRQLEDYKKKLKEMKELYKQHNWPLTEINELEKSIEKLMLTVKTN